MYKRFLCMILTVLFLCALLPFSAGAEEYVNLAKNVTCIVEISEPISFSYGLLTDGDELFETNNGRLTDENIATADSESSAWYRAYRGGSRIVRFDFGDEVALSGVSAGFLFDASKDICPPRYIKVYLSDDGVNYGIAAQYDATYPLPYVSPQRCEISLDFDEIYSARYVNVEFSCDNYVYCDEVSIFGKEALLGTESKAEIPDTDTPATSYPSDVFGAKDIICLQAGSFSLSEARPIVGYISSNGDISGRMFDSVCLSPSGKDLERYLSNLSSSFEILQETAQEVYSTIDSDEKLRIFVVLPYPEVSENETLETRFETIKAFIDECILLFSDNAYKNLRFCGFFWGQTQMDFNSSNHETDLVKNTNQYIRQNNLASVFEAEYLGAGFDIWQDLGFNCSVMHTDYSRKEWGEEFYFDVKMLSQFAQSALKYNSGAFLEFDNISYFESEEFQKSGANYESHLYYGYKNGYMNGVTAYSGNENIFDYLCRSDINTPKGIYLRRLYDLTYNFIHRTYENLAPQLELETNHDLHFGDSGITIDIDITDGDSYWYDIVVEFPVLPKHGNVVASSNKKELIYNVDEGFMGEDSFTVRVTDGFGYSVQQTVNLSIKEFKPTETPKDEFSEDESSSFESDISNVSKGDTQKGDNNYLLPIFCGIGIIVALATVLGIGIMAKKRK